MSFCGSTFLSRLIDVPNYSLVLKEPNCLVDLADWKTANVRAGRSIGRLQPALGLASGALRRPFGLGELVTIKPSSWVNNLLDEFTAEPDTVLPVFVTISRSAFLRAVFRGGTQRLAFTARLAAHLAANVPNGDQLVRMAIKDSEAPLGRVANLAVVAHYIQLLIFERALRRGGWSRERLIDFDEISKSPFDAARRASRALRLGLESGDIENAVRKNAGWHSKAQGFRFSANQIESDDEHVVMHHRDVLEAAGAWGERQLDKIDEGAAA